jgi:hypothetical protein
VSDQVAHPYKTTIKIIFLYIWFLSILELKLQILPPRTNLLKLKPKLCASKMISICYTWRGRKRSATNTECTYSCPLNGTAAGV